MTIAKITTPRSTDIFCFMVFPFVDVLRFFGVLSGRPFEARPFFLPVVDDVDCEDQYRRHL